MAGPSRLVFVNVSDPAADSPNVRRLVRSSATRHSHRTPGRKPKARKADRRSLQRSSPTLTIDEQSNPTSHPVLMTEESTSSCSTVLTNAQSDSRISSPILTSIEQPDLRESSTDVTSLAQSNFSTSLFTQDDRVKIANKIEQCESLQGQYISYANNSYPVEAEEWFAWALSYTRTVFLPHGIHILQQSDREGEEFIAWFMQQGSEPALFYMQLLLACPQLVNGAHLELSHIEWLKDMTVRSINKAITNERTNSNAILLAVALLAFHEKIYGNETLATDVHGRAVTRMIEIRGLDNINLPRLAWCLLLWIDMVISDSLDDQAIQLLATWVPEEWRPAQPD